MTIHIPPLNSPIDARHGAGILPVMKSLILLVVLVGCASTPPNPNWVSDPSDPNNVKIEKAIRKALKTSPTAPTTTSWVSDPSDSNNVKIEAAIRQAAGKPTGELTKVDLEKVTMLDLDGNQLTSVKRLEKLTQLRFLFLNDNQLTDVKVLEKLTQLTELRLRGNQLSHVKGLEKLTELKVLWFNDNQLTNVKGLEKLTQLKSLFLKNNPALTKTQINELQKALPKCKIYSNFD